MAGICIANAILSTTIGLPSAKAATSHSRYVHFESCLHPLPVTSQPEILTRYPPGVMVKGMCQFFATDPRVVNRAIEGTPHERIGGQRHHCELDVLRQICAFLSYFQLPLKSHKPHHRRIDRHKVELMSIIPRGRARTYNIRKVMRLLLGQDVEAVLLLSRVPLPWGRGESLLAFRASVGSRRVCFLETAPVTELPSKNMVQLFNRPTKHETGLDC